MADMLYLLEEFIHERRTKPKEGSYTNSLFDSGVNKIAQKVGEEATEVIVAALGQGRKEQIGELSDLFYHTLVLMTQLGITLEDVSEELRRQARIKLIREQVAWDSRQHATQMPSLQNSL